MRCTRQKILMTGAAMLLLGGGTSWAESEAVTVHLAPSEIWVEPHVAGEALSFTVSCDNGTYVTQEYGMGERPAFQPVDKYGPWPDGQCKYEVRISPPADQQAMKAAEAARDDGLVELLAQEEAEKMVTLTGGFEVINGQIVPIVEPPAEEEEASDVAHGHTH